MVKQKQVDMRNETTYSLHWSFCGHRDMFAAFVQYPTSFLFFFFLFVYQLQKSKGFFSLPTFHLLLLFNLLYKSL